MKQKLAELLTSCTPYNHPQLNNIPSSTLNEYHILTEEQDKLTNIKLVSTDNYRQNFTLHCFPTYP